MQLSVILVHYQTPDYLELCLWAIRKAVQDIAAEILVVDNASPSPEVQALSRYFPEVTWIWNTRNLGFGAACNRAAAQASGTYLLFLNPDTLIDPGGLQRALIFMDQHPEVHALGPYLQNSKGAFLKEARRAFPTPWNSLCKILGLDDLFPRSRLLAGYYAGDKSTHEVQPAEVLCGACMLIRKKAWDAVAGFDETYFLYGEDTDLCLRLHQQGLQAYFFPDWKVLHFKYRSMRSNPKVHRYYFFQAMKTYVQKHFPHHRWYLFPGIELVYRLSRLSSKFRPTPVAPCISQQLQGTILTSPLHPPLPSWCEPPSWRIREVTSDELFSLFSGHSPDHVVVVHTAAFTPDSFFRLLLTAGRQNKCITWISPYTGKLVIHRE
ncbi:glycosyltransferase family 2 protein [Thermoflavifilum thermophilum]|uniref:Glycosyltransferase, GT2 family n=1 Tax=Thermoflavifilum thermophilum TaxID=1393122 RepID=A0A1I7ND30_9BACT|nr:glycosyltransferase family 2 protein [Thermoflavifilum thermophilum]SFV32588.1 Glycosyltransferase, GT2 family [Thermoflavifilum thermophilum]